MGTMTFSKDMAESFGRMIETPDGSFDIARKEESELSDIYKTRGETPELEKLTVRDSRAPELPLSSMITLRECTLITGRYRGVLARRVRSRILIST